MKEGLEGRNEGRIGRKRNEGRKVKATDLAIMDTRHRKQ
jgi:hypothetical protein